MFFPLWHKSPWWARAFLIIEASGSHSDTPHSVELIWTSGQVSPSQRPLPDNTKHSQDRDIRSPGGIRIYNHSKRAATGIGKNNITERY